MEKRIRKYFIVIISGILLCILTLGSILFTSTMRRVYLDQMERTNENLAEQIRSSFELVIQQISEQVNKHTIYESQLGQFVRESQVTVVNYIYLYEDLKQIVLGNQYIHSVYLYSEEDQTFFDSKRGNRYTIGEFYDQTVAEAIQSNYRANVWPHLIRGDVLVYSLLVPIKADYTNASYVLSVNIDVGMLYKDIVSRNSGDGEVQLYVYDENQRITISNDHSDLNQDIVVKQDEIYEAFPNQNFWSLLNDKVGIMDAVAYSSVLNSYFYVQVPFSFNLTSMFNNYFTLVVILAILLFAIVAAYVIFCYTTKPIQAVMTDYQDKLLRDFICGSSKDSSQMAQVKATIEQHFKYDHYRLWLIDRIEGEVELSRFVTTTVEGLPELADKPLLKVISISPNRVAIIVNAGRVSAADQLETTFLERFYKELDPSDRGRVYFSAGSGISNPELLSLAYRECDDMQQYKLSMPQQLMHYGSFYATKKAINYPVELEKQLINNLLSKNFEGSVSYTEAFIAHIFEADGMLSDIQIKNYIYQLQNEVLARATALPITIKPITSTEIEGAHKREHLSGILLRFIDSICAEIYRNDEESETVLNQTILEYIDANYTQNHFNLNSLSYQFNMNRNQLAKLIKEETSYSFNEYINAKKIELAKELLSTSALTVEEIAHRTGFTYAHYFIKVFKSIEGITPGQFREMHNNSNNAQEICS